MYWILDSKALFRKLKKSKYSKFSVIKNWNFWAIPMQTSADCMQNCVSMQYNPMN